MIAPREFLEIADAFCGAGGSSTGLRLAFNELGLHARLRGLNHWATAIATHEANHPDAEHHCVDAYKADLRKVVPGGRLDLLMASPTCIYFSTARGGKPISWDQRWGRMTPTQVIRFVTELDVRRILVENVREFQGWGPVHREDWKPRRNENGKKCRAAKCKPGFGCRWRKGRYFRAWLRRLDRAGYRYEYRVLCSADFGDATTRKRFYLIGTKEPDEPIVWPEPTHAQDGADGLPRWRSARECIDPSIRGTSIFTRKKRLSTKTLERIFAGLVRYRWPWPFIAKLRAFIDRKPLPRFTTADLVAAGCVEPELPELLLVPQGSNAPARPADEPVPTVVAIPRVGVVEPFIDVARANAQGASVDEPLRTVCAGGTHHFLVEPLVLPQHGGGCARSVGDPLPTVATDGAVGLIVPYYGTGVAKDLDEPLPTVTTRDRFALVVPVTHAGERRPRSIDEPLPTVTAAHRGELAFITAAYGERQGQPPRTHSVDDPVPSIAATGSVRLIQGDPIEVDILYRMLVALELARAMGFPDDYRFVYRVLEDLTRQIGNAVSVNTAAALVRAIFSPLIARRCAA